MGRFLTSVIATLIMGAWALNRAEAPPRRAAAEVGAIDVRPIDFTAAANAAKQALADGATAEQAAALAARVVDGHRPFHRLPIGAISEEWLDLSATRVALHCAVNHPGWETLPMGRSLRLEPPWPDWLGELSVALAEPFGGGSPARCTLYALEPGQASELCGAVHDAVARAGRTIACVALRGRGRLACSSGGEEHQLDLNSGACYLLGGASSAGASLSVNAGDERLVVVVFESGGSPRRE